MSSMTLERNTNLEETAALLAHLVSFKSFPGMEGNVQRAVAQWFRANGMQPLVEDLGADRPNVTVRLENGEGPTLLLNGHVDTVLEAAGWTCDPWQGQRDGNTFYGLGACDMKSGVAALMLATRALDKQRERWKGTVIFTSVVDEEAYSIGARALVDAHLRADACIVAEPSFDEPIIGAVGKVLVRCDVTGKASHGSQPELGINAAVEGAKLLARLDEMRLRSHPRLKASQSVLSYYSGSDQYVITVPEHARFTINRHIVPGDTGESVLAEMEALAESLHSPARFSFAIDPPYYPPWEMQPQHTVLQTFAQAYTQQMQKPPTFGYSGGVADANYFAADLGIPTLYFGPRGDRLHQADEWVDLESIVVSLDIYLKFCHLFLNSKSTDTSGNP